MKFSAPPGLFLAALVGAVLLPPQVGRAQIALADGTNRTASVPALPPLPKVKSPVDQFRELLAMTPVERKHFLSARTPENQRLILAKIREYESLRPEQRELRLKVTELRWYLLPLMQSAPTNRASQLQAIPEATRSLVETRLKEWDALSPDVRKELLDNEATLRYFTEVESGPGDISPARREKLQAGIDQWRALPEAQRRKIAIRFNQFFDLTATEKDKALEIVSDAERAQIEKTLRTYGNLPPQQRIQCLRSFEKFASLSVEERQQFLKNAERWKLMTPSERQDWRELVTKLSQPPLPGSTPMPPLPPVRSRPRASLPLTATNAAR